ncbi:serine/threonine-protein kinase [Anaeramoeba flamelloides]|uniref:non-specific serine/threonine protein kinase n=1 Tax=Anaeramoeba flamelloides TaxID=1746091 RepID=A0AAV8A1R3_9EUKA|nr:serine/threonine-protein kinase [Anaeramoeba flamelloides]
MTENLSNKNPNELFEIVDKLGEGSYGSVHQAVTKTGQIVAIKKVPIEEDIDSIIKEISIMKQCDHVRLVKYYDSYFLDNELWHPFIKNAKSTKITLPTLIEQCKIAKEKTNKWGQNSSSSSSGSSYSTGSSTGSESTSSTGSDSTSESTGSSADSVVGVESTSNSDSEGSTGGGFSTTVIHDVDSIKNNTDIEEDLGASFLDQIKTQKNVQTIDEEQQQTNKTIPRNTK